MTASNLKPRLHVARQHVARTSNMLPDNTLLWCKRGFMHQLATSLRCSLQHFADIIARRRQSLFGHIARFADCVPAHDVLKVQIDLASGRTPGGDWKYCHGSTSCAWRTMAESRPIYGYAQCHAQAMLLRPLVFMR